MKDIQMKKDEITILKSMMVKLDDSNALLVALQYHSELHEDGLKAGKTDRSKTRYRWIARTANIEELKKKIMEMSDDSNALAKCKWPGDTSGWYTATGAGCANIEIASWLSMKLKKIKSWEDGMKALDGWEGKTKTHEARQNLKAKYETEGFEDTTAPGTTISLKDKVTLLKNIGHTFIKNVAKV